MSARKKLGPTFDENGDYVRKVRHTSPKAERGMPCTEGLTALAETYLEIQNQHWLNKLNFGLPSSFANLTVANMTDNFRQRFLSPYFLDPELKLARGQRFAVAYVRYSDNNSSPRSLAQQLRKILDRAAVDRVFIPWQLVYADAAMPGTDPHRQGYRLTGKALEDTEVSADILFLDEIGRASREAIAAMQLGRYVAEGLGTRCPAPTSSRSPSDWSTPHTGRRNGTRFSK